MGEITLQFGVGQQDLHRVRTPRPPGIPRPGPARYWPGRRSPRRNRTRPPRARAGGREGGPRRGGRRPHAGQLGAALDLDPAISTACASTRWSVHLPDQRQVREGRVRQREIGERDPDDPGAKPQVRRWRDVGPGQQRLRDPERAQYLQRTGIFSKLSRRNRACPQAAHRPQPELHHQHARSGVRPGPPASPGTPAPRCRRRSAAASRPGPQAGESAAATGAVRCWRSSPSAPAAPPRKPAEAVPGRLPGAGRPDRTFR